MTAPGERTPITVDDLQELRNAVVVLASRVTDLSEALTVVNDIQQRQQVTEKKVDANTSKVQEVAATSFTQHDAEVQIEVRNKALREQRRGILRRVYVVATTVVTLGALTALALFLYAKGTKPFDPLDNSRGQAIDSRVEGIAGPAVLVNDAVEVTGTKCNDSKSPVTVTGVVTWSLFKPPGTSYTVSRGTSVRQPGCLTRTYQNTLPPEVVQKTRDLYSSGVTDVEWTIIGVETPSGKNAVSETWQTEPFRIVVQ